MVKITWEGKVSLSFEAQLSEKHTLEDAENVFRTDMPLALKELIDEGLFGLFGIDASNIVINANTEEVKAMDR